MGLSRRSLLGGLAFCAAGAVRAGAARAADGPVQIYAAMTFHVALDAVLQAYRARGGEAVAVYAPTPVLVRQLDQGAPADILLTADPMWMDDAAKRGLIRPETRANLLANELVLAGPAGARDAGMLGRGFQLATVLGAGRLAMCDPENDPAGRFGRQSLQSLDLWSVAAPRIAVTETAPAAVTMVDRGEVSAAVAFATDLHGDAHATIIGRFPSDSHGPIVYPVALTRNPPSPHAQAALDFLRSAEALRIFISFGYRAPG